MQATGLSRMTIYRLELAGKFPTRNTIEPDPKVGYVRMRWLHDPEPSNVFGSGP
jgi:predicted DNA-binding transcriptional regulator AlpA